METTKTLPANTTDVFNLIEKHQKNRETILAEIKTAWNYEPTHLASTTDNPKFKIGDIIEFWGGHDDDIRFKSEIIGFTPGSEIFVLWDCYWLPIKDDSIRKIVKLS